MMMDGLDRFLESVERLKMVKPGQWTASCPSARHKRGDVRPSLSINRGNGSGMLFHCHGGCSPEDVLAGVGMKWKDILPLRETARRTPSPAAASQASTVKQKASPGAITRYEIRDASGTPLAVHVREDHPAGKKIWWELPDGTIGLGGRKLETLPLYGIDRLPTDAKVVVLAEGEKATDALLQNGIAVLGTVTGASGTPSDDTLRVLLGRPVYLWPDNDDAGRKHMNKIGAALLRLGHRDFRIIEWKDAPDKGDAADLFRQEGAMDEFSTLMYEARPFIVEDEPTITVTTSADDSTEPIYTSGDLPTATNAAWEAIKRENVPPTMFRHGGLPVRLGEDETGRPVFEILTIDRMRHVVARAAPWKSRRVDRHGKVVEKDVPPPLDVIKDILATPADKMPLPVVTGIVEVPTFAADGTLCDRPGYNPENRTYYAPPPGLVIPKIPERPTEEDVRRARELLMEPINEMKFAGDADMTHTLALGILPYVRDLVGPYTPIHLFDAPIHGSGKTKSATVMLMPAMGDIQFVTQTDDEEFRKRLTTMAISGRTVFFLDNVTRSLNSAVLSSAITGATWTDRVLGRSGEISVPNRMIWVVTGNNVMLSGELTRRGVHIRIDPDTDQPWLRTGFRIPNLEGWVRENRARMVAAALTLVRAWIVGGRVPFSGAPIGGLESWSNTVGGILENAGVGGFLSNLTELYEAADVENLIWREFVLAWWAAHCDMKVGIRDLYPIAEKIDGIDLGTTNSERAQRTSLGAQLRAKKNVVVGEFKITPDGKKDGAQLWRLTPTRRKG